MKFIKKILILWVIFYLLDPYLGPDCESGSGFRDPIESGSNPDPDPLATTLLKCQCKSYLLNKNGCSVLYVNIIVFL
jgi:hypothetical protein